ncbi:MAG: hypothetical protein RLZZ299_2480 [Pseudomonadota bacterium]|jgi:hypothetical protein
MRAITFSMLLAVGFVVAGCGASRDTGGKDSSPPTATTTATATSTASGTDTDTGRPDVGDVSTYEAFIATHAVTYCNALKTCRALARAGYTDRAACVAQITAQYSRRTCETYQPDAGLRCVQADLGIAQECREAAQDTATDSGDTGGAPEVDARQPPVCQNVCNVRDTATGTGTSTSR